MPPRRPEDVPSWLPGFIKATAELFPPDLEQRILRRDAEEAVALEEEKERVRQERRLPPPQDSPASIAWPRRGRPAGLTKQEFLEQNLREHPLVDGVNLLSDGQRANLLAEKLKRPVSVDQVQRIRYNLRIPAYRPPRNAK